MKWQGRGKRDEVGIEKEKEKDSEMGRVLMTDREDRMHCIENRQKNRQVAVH